MFAVIRRRRGGGSAAAGVHQHPELFLARNSVFELIVSIEMIVDMWRSSFPKSFGQTEQVTGGIRLVTVNRNRP